MLQALHAEDMETVQKLGILIGFHANSTVELVFYFFHSIFNSTELRNGKREQGSHYLKGGERLG